MSSTCVSGMPEKDKRVDPESDKGNQKKNVMYTVDEIPPWNLITFLSFQHYLSAFVSHMVMPLMLAPSLCLKENDLAMVEIIGTQFFVSGLATLIQSTFGTRLPIVQGPPPTFAITAIALLRLPQFQCPAMSDFINSTMDNGTVLEAFENSKDEAFRRNMREVQGAMIIASLFQIVAGGFGIMGCLLKVIGPLAIAPTLGLIGLSLAGVAAKFSSTQWWISLTTTVLAITFSQYMAKIRLPCYDMKRRPGKSAGCKTVWIPFFSMFPVILAVFVTWFICYILTITNTLTDDENGWGYSARTDIETDILHTAAWFRFPYPTQWGLPTVSVAGVFGMLSAVLAGMVESVGDYCACAGLGGVPPPPEHAVNRGMLAEGLGCFISGLWGTGNGVTSYSGNIGIIALTKVGSRLVVQIAAFIFIALGMVGKFGAIFVTVPLAIYGGTIVVTFGMVTAVGMSNLQFVNLNSPRNLLIVGISFFFGMSLPNWMASHPNAIKTGEPIVDQILTVLLSTGMFVGGLVGFILDNTIPGSDEERGIKAWRELIDRTDEAAKGPPAEADLSTYDLPWCMRGLRRAKCLRYVPFCPTFQSQLCSCGCRKKNASNNKIVNGDVEKNEPHNFDSTQL